MKRFVVLLSAAALALALPAAGSAAEKAAEKVPDGKPIFAKYKCGSCHSIESQGIVKKAAEGEAAEAEGASSKAPDLGGVGAVRTADWMRAFLLKTEKLDGKLHIKKFRGTEDELKQVTGWLASLKDEAAAKKLKKAEDKSEKAADKAEEKAEKTEPKSDK